MKEGDTGAWYWWNIMVWILGKCWGPGGHRAIMAGHKISQRQTRFDPLQHRTCHGLGSDLLCSSSMGQTADQTDCHHHNFQASCLPLIYPGLLVLGLSCGLSNPLSAIYITEIAGMANKGIVTSMFNFNLTFGILLTNVVGSLTG